MNKRPNVGRQAQSGSSAPAQRTHSVSASMQNMQQTLSAKLANPELRAQKVNQMYDKQFGGHGNSRHGAQTTTAQHNQRVLTGANPDGGTGNAVRNSSHWASQQTQLAARHAAQNEFRNNQRTGAAQPTQSNGNMAFTPSLGGGTTGAQSTRIGSVKNAQGVSNTNTTGAKVVLRPSGGYLTDYPE